MRWLALVIALASAGCSKASTEAEKKQWPDKPPPKDVPPPSDLAIAYTVDGAPAGQITAAMLAAAKPDFEDAERSAWLVATLIPAAAAPGSTVQATSRTGVSVTFARPGANGVEPVVFLTRRGEVIVSAVDPKDPFPAYHGQGGRLHRPGDSLPRVVPVATLAITRGAP